MPCRASNQKRRRGNSRRQQHPEGPSAGPEQQQQAPGDEEEWVEVEEGGGRPVSGRAWQSAWWAPATGGEQQDRRAVRQRMLNYGNRFR